MVARLWRQTGGMLAAAQSLLPGVRDADGMAQASMLTCTTVRGAKVTDIELSELHAYFRDGASLARLIEAAAGVANAIQVGTGALIRGTLMEREFREALGLNPGEMVNIPKPKRR